MRRFLVVAFVLPALVAGCENAGNGVELRGRGSTFVQPVMKLWAEKYADQTGDVVRLDYQGTGSGNGVAAMTNREVDFGCSDAPMSAKQLAAARERGGEAIHIPLVLGAVVPVYNVPGLTAPLTFTGDALADIFLGAITHWNDPKLIALNPSASLPDLKIQPVYRDDPSGTTFLFADYLCKASAEFRRVIGKPSNEPAWPRGVGTRQPKSDGVAGHVGRTVGAIGYVELTYALDTGAQFGGVRNKAGKVVVADLDGITAAARCVKLTDAPGGLTFSLTDADGERSYPIAGTSYAILYRAQRGEKGRATVAFLRWATSDGGQAMAKARNFAPLPPDLRQKVAAELDKIEFTD